MNTVLHRLNRIVQRVRMRHAVRRGVPPSFRFRGREYWVNPDAAAVYHIVESTQKIADMTDLIPADTGVIFDVGANCGLFSAFAAASCPNASIHCFEPSPNLVPIIRKNLAHSKVAIHEVAVNETNREAEFFINKDSEQCNSLNRRAAEFLSKAGRVETHVVQCVSLDQFAADHRIGKVDVLKVDVQGFEGAVFRGARRLLPTVEMLFVESTWIDVESITQLVPFALDYGFTHAAVISPVYTGADILLSRSQITAPAIKLSFALDRELLARRWS